MRTGPPPLLAVIPRAMLAIVISIVVLLLGGHPAAAGDGDQARAVIVHQVVDAGPTPVDPGPIVVGDDPADTTTDVVFSVSWAVFLVGSVMPVLVNLLTAAFLVIGTSQLSHKLLWSAGPEQALHRALPGGLGARRAA